jgi:chemotaxis protein methyltransferase WspC
MAGEMRALEELLSSRIGLDPTSVGSQLIQRAALQRMRDLKLDDLGAYARRVRHSEPELQELIEEVVVAESWFFRDERPFEWLLEYVKASWLIAPGRPPLRILSLACAAGEEPFSVAIVFKEAGLPAHRYRIDACDISARRLAIARRGVYSLNAFRGSEAFDRTRYFRQHVDGYELDPALRATVRFFQASVLDPRLLEGSPLYDVVFCRNLLIYLTPRARTTVLATIDRVLASDGLLVIGHADRLDRSIGTGGGFTATGDPGCFAYRRLARSHSPVHSDPPSLELPSLTLSLVAPVSASAITNTNPLATNSSSFLSGNPAALEARSPRSAEPSLLLDRAAELANRGRFTEAIAECERQLRQHGLAAPPYYLMGMICQAAGDRRRAEDCFQKTVYLDPTHDEALLALALLAERRGDQKAAVGFRRRAERTVSMGRKRVN